MAKADPKQVRRDATKIVRILRNFFLGRKYTSATSVTRFAPDISKRTQPFPNLPLGPANKLYNNYYNGRDPRGEVKHPEEIVGPEVEKIKRLKVIDPWDRCDVKKKGHSLNILPGKVHHWDKIVD